MRSLNKNKQKIYYSTYQGKLIIFERDEKGEIIYDEIDGELLPRILTEKAGYGEPDYFFANASAAKGRSDEEVFGVSLDYSKTISTTDMALPITETSLIWIETEPVIKAGVVDESSADYSVVAVARSLNSVVYALKNRKKGN